MATLVLSTVGTALGGPIGGALGSLVGQAIDQQLFGPGPRHGPRLGDLSIQTSSYGTPIPRVYGTMRVAGSVIWATDLKEEEAIQGGGKAGPEVVSYSYSASFAVALSSRPAQRVARIWADGKLLRGEAGDFKVPCTFRLLPGEEDQALDPLIASIEGMGGSPAFRGLAVAVFDDLSLVDYGNRIPVITFELVADEGGSDVGSILSDASRGSIAAAADEGMGVSGYAAYGSDQRAAISALVDLWNVDVRDVGGQLEVVGGPAPVAVAGATERNCAGSERPSDETRSQIPARTLPAAAALTFYDPSRDYQSGQVRAVVAGGGRTDWRLDCPIVLTADKAKRLVNDVMTARWATRDRMTLRLPPAFLALQPGSLMKVSGHASLWSVDQVTIDGMVVIAEVQRASSRARCALMADSGRFQAEPDIPIGPTVITLIDMPDWPDAADAPLSIGVAVSAAGAFRPVAIQLSSGEQMVGACTMTRRAVLGRAVTALDPTPSTLLFDLQSEVTVELVDPEQILLNADDEALSNGANLCLLGRELIQFGRATALGDGRYRLSRFLRGRRATEWASNLHQPGEPFLLIDASSIVRVPVNTVLRGAEIKASAYGIADDLAAPPTASAIADGESLRPLPPCQLEFTAIEGGGAILRWQRRDRKTIGWPNDDGAADLQSFLFEVTLSNERGRWSATTVERSVEVPVEALAGLGTGAVEVAVCEVTSTGKSRPIRKHFIIV